eukprot:1179925-Prorocentrum_minimum.AAC.4
MRGVLVLRIRTSRPAGASAKPDGFGTHNKRVITTAHHEKTIQVAARASLRRPLSLPIALLASGACR